MTKRDFETRKEKMMNLSNQIHAPGVPPNPLAEITGLQYQIDELSAALEAANREIELLQNPLLAWTLMIDGQAVSLNPPLTVEEARTWAGLLAAQFPANRFQVVTA